MPNPEPIRTELFRFVTLKSVQRISNKKKKIGFIWHPDFPKSFFYKYIDQNDLDKSRLTILEIRKQYPEIINKYQQTRELSPDLYDLSDWLKENIDSLDYDKISSRVAGIKQLEEKELILIWDNLFYQILDRSNPTVRQACIQLITANYFLQEFQISDFKNTATKFIETPKLPEEPSEGEKIILYTKRLVKSKVVVPREFTRKKQKAIPNIGKSNTLNKGASDFINSKLGILMGMDELNELQKIETKFNSLSFQSISSLGIDTSRQKKKINTADLNFSKEEMGFLQEQGFNDEATPKSWSRKLTNRINQIKKEIAKAGKPSKKVHLFNGKKLPDKEIGEFNYALSIKPKAKNIQIAIKVPKGQSIIEGKAVLNFKKGGYTTSSSTLVTSMSMEDYVLLKFVQLDYKPLENHDHLVITGELTLSTGRTMAFHTEGNTSQKNFTGQGTPISFTNSDLESESGEETTENNITPAPMFGVNNLGFGVFRKVEQEVCCYVPGEVSRIENVMAREYKERHTRNLTKTENTEEIIEEVEVEQKTDTATTARHELNSEIVNTLNKSTNLNTGANIGFSSSWGGEAFKLSTGATFGFASSNSSQLYNKEAQTLAQEVTQNALDRLVQKVAKKRTSKIIQEFEENNRHGFDNRSGDQHVTGVYRWVDIIYKNRLVNYGNRLMVEFLIPEPSKLYKWAIEQELEETGSSSSGTTLEEPLSLVDNAILGPESITRQNYEDHGRLYGLTSLPSPQPEVEQVSKPHELDWRDDPSVTKEINTREEEYNFSIMISPQYRLKSVTIRIEYDYHYKSGERGTFFELEMGDLYYLANKASTEDSNAVPDTKFESTGTGQPDVKKIIATRTHTFSEEWTSSIPIEVGVRNIHDFKLNITTNEEVDSSVDSVWKQDIYYLILDAYNKRRDEYEESLNQAVAEAEENEKEKAEKNPAFNRTLEKREIQRAAIQMLTQYFAIPMGETDFYTDGSCGEPIITQTEEWENYSSHVKFFEQAFDWKTMDYIFYPYYWAQKCSWAELIQTKDSADPIFEAFLQSGMARVLVPARLGFEQAVNYYFETGDIWNGGDLVIETDDDLYLSIAEEIEEVEGTVGEEWQSRVPTSLTVIQSDSVALEQSGLPCCDQIDEEGLGLLASTNKLELLNTSQDAES